MSFVDKFLANRGANKEGQMAFTDHLEELRWHVVRSIIALIIGAVFAFINIEYIFHEIILGPSRPTFVSYKYLCQLGKVLHIDELCMNGVTVKFQNTQLTGQFMLSFSSSALFGFIIAFPYILWEFWRFIKPAMKTTELKYAKGLVFWGSLLFLLGIGFAYYVIAPFTISFFASYVLSEQFENIITIGNYYDTMSDLILGLGFVFEIPILVFFLSKLGILTPKLLKEKRRYAVVIILVLAAFITPPDWFSIFLVFLPLYSLYEISIIVSGIIQRKKLKEEELNKPLDW